MNVFDIIGPVMIGPSSSHTAGAVRLGRVVNKLCDADAPDKVEITLSGSFAETYKGHGTDRALMAGIMLELAGPDDAVEIVPGVTAACAAAAMLGAPLVHDFVVISLSDLLTPWELIEKRLDAAAMGDFVICLYNPMSRGRPDNLRKACEILLRHKSPDTASGWVRNAGREGAEASLTTLGELKDAELDMFCTVIIGNHATKELHGRLVTPRGYLEKQ